MTDPCSVMHLIRPRPPSEIGGADLHIADLSEAQRAAGNEVAVFSFGVNPPFAALLRERGVECVEVPGESLRTWYATVCRAMAERQPNIVHSHGYRADLVAALLRWGRHCQAAHRPALVMSVHGFVRNGLLFRALTRLNEFCLRAADLVVTTSAEEAARLGAKGLPTVRFIPNGVRPLPDAPRDYLAEQLGVRAARRMLYVGRLSPEKRPDLFLEAARLLADRWPDLDFVMIGSGPLEAGVRALAERAGLTSRTCFAGLRRDVGRLLCGADVLVCPSDTEGTPRAVIEAMSSGVPVVATRVGGLPDLIADGTTGVLVPPGVAGPLADAVDELLAHPEQARRIARAAAEQARDNFAIELMENRTARAYADIHDNTEVVR
ncbi:glycosyltransferase family 4 protein [Streptomyces sp. NPDC004237]|uniref:glycosyltransferase family 4 protein n=1 Tax=Streptomyces sp. NPDC004237 TaxID=3154455 RepID=UPI0033A587B2